MLTPRAGLILASAAHIILRFVGLLKALPSEPDRQLPLAWRFAVSPAPLSPALTALMTSVSSRKLLLRAAVLNHAPWRAPSRAAPWMFTEK